MAQLFGENHVVILGYSGSDSDLLAALRRVERGRSSQSSRVSAAGVAKEGKGVTGQTAAPEGIGRDHRTRVGGGEAGAASPRNQPGVEIDSPYRLFLLDVDEPHPQMVPVMRGRQSQYLSIQGPEGAFENVMAGLHLLAQHGQKGLRTERPQPHAILTSWGDGTFMTQAEQEALANCRSLALDIRARINVSEVSRIGIDSHAREIFLRCLRLARHSGNALTLPERYLLSCVSILHDLGYFEGYGRGEVARPRGWWFLNMHGSMTADLLTSCFRQDREHLRAIYPETYGATVSGLEEFETALIDLCLCHPNTLEFDFERVAETPGSLAEALGWKQNPVGEGGASPEARIASTAKTLRGFLGLSGEVRADRRKIATWRYSIPPGVSPPVSGAKGSTP